MSQSRNRLRRRRHPTTATALTRNAHRGEDGGEDGAALAVVTAAAALLSVTGVASAAQDGGGTATGKGTNALFSFEFDVAQNSADPRDAEGYFRAAGVPPSDLLIAPQGPATCVEVRGNTVGFLYPLAEGSRPAALEGSNVLITAVDNGPGHPDAIGFVPVGIDPGGCAPNLATLTSTSGDIVIEDRG